MGAIVAIASMILVGYLFTLLARDIKDRRAQKNKLLNPDGTKQQKG